eukprot:318771-Amorphochlora_amoeboformis.AAC.1
MPSLPYLSPPSRSFPGARAPRRNVELTFGLGLGLVFFEVLRLQLVYHTLLCLLCTPLGKRGEKREREREKGEKEKGERGRRERKKIKKGEKEREKKNEEKDKRDEKEHATRAYALVVYVYGQSLIDTMRVESH